MVHFASTSLKKRVFKKCGVFWCIFWVFVVVVVGFCLFFLFVSLFCFVFPVVIGKCLTGKLCLHDLKSEMDSSRSKHYSGHGEKRNNLIMWYRAEFEINLLMKTEIFTRYKIQLAKIVKIQIQLAN